MRFSIIFALVYPKTMKDASDKAWVRRCMSAAEPILRLKTIGEENILSDQGPSVFICNHGEIYGAIAAVMYLPVHFRIWAHDKMLDREKAAATMMETYKERFPLLIKGVKNRMIWRISKPVTDAICSLDPIPVSRENPICMIDTINESVDALCAGDNLLIFPEKPENRYNGDAFKNMYPVFGILGLKYFERTGKRLLFYPAFSNSETKTFTIGKPVVYIPGTDPREEIERIVSEIESRMVQLSEQNYKN